jgi:hypothetical protein
MTGTTQHFSLARPKPRTQVEDFVLCVLTFGLKERNMPGGEFSLSRSIFAMKIKTDNLVFSLLRSQALR